MAACEYCPMRDGVHCDQCHRAAGVAAVMRQTRPKVEDREALKQARLAGGWSQWTVAKIIGVPLSTFQKWERGVNTPPPHHADAWREAVAP